MVNLTVKILFLSFFLSLNLFAQQDTTTANKPMDKDTAVFKMHKSPWGAVLRSAIIPGWGQIYNKSYWKAPIVWGLLGFYAYYWKVNNDGYLRNRQRFLNDPKNPYYEQYRNSYRDQRDLVALYMGLTYFLSLVDAYVDAQLFDFTVDENPYLKTPQLNLKIHF